MKIAILTFSHAINRGAHMQCYALSKTLMRLGHHVEVIHIELPVHTLSWKGYINRFILSQLNHCFRHKYYPHISRAYKSASALRQDCPDADIYIVGSDQVWNPNITKDFGIEAFFLDFVPDNKRKIAYAASFGESDWIPTKQDKHIKGLLQRFDRISVRELTGINICKDTFGITDVNVVVDPVFLLDNYASILGNVKKQKDNIVCYPLCTNDTIKTVFNEASTDLHLLPISFAKSIGGNGINVKLFSSIQYWLRRINQASMVVTNSFHCMAFCIIFRKNFIVTPPHKGRESRIVSMLEQLGIPDRYVQSIEDYRHRKFDLYNDIDYVEVSARLNVLRMKALDFLKESL